MIWLHSCSGGLCALMCLHELDLNSIKSHSIKRSQAATGSTHVLLCLQDNLSWVFKTKGAGATCCMIHSVTLKVLQPGSPWWL